MRVGQVSTRDVGADSLARVVAAVRLPTGAALALDPDELGADLATVSDADLAGVGGVLLHLARIMEPPLRMAERRAALRRLLRLSPDGQLRRQAEAETAIDLAKENRLDEAEAAARAVLDLAGADEAIAQARATEALGRVNAWRGTAAAAGRARILLADAAQRYAALGALPWQGSVIFWSANTVDYQRGALAAAEQGMRDALPLLGPGRQAVVLTFLGDLLGYQGRTSEARAVLSRAAELANGEEIITAYATWSEARLASYAGDAATTVRLVAETDRELAALALTNTLVTFAADAAELLDRVGERSLARDYLARAAGVDPDDEFVRLATASALARHGDPAQALTALRQVLLEPWLEARLVWRITLLTAWATLRADRLEAGVLARRALEQAAALGGIDVALTTESALTLALLPVAAAAGSSAAAKLLHPAGTVVRLLGRATARLAETDTSFPSGLPGGLARLVLSSPVGRTVDEVVDTFWPEEEPETARRRLRQVLSRLGARLPGLVERQGDRLVGSAWVDLCAFQSGAATALAAGDPDLAQAALALWGGVPLPTDAYSDWAVTERERLVALRVRLLDLLAEDAERRASRAEALRRIEAAIAEDRYDELRYERAARLHLAQGHRTQARHMLAEGRAMLQCLGVAAPASWASLQRDIDAGD